MVKLILDANILISLKTIGLFDKFITFLEEEKQHTIIMSKDNLMECGSLMSKMRRCQYFSEIDSVDTHLIGTLRAECKRLIKKELHTAEGRDYHLILCALKDNVNADFIVTNDRTLILFFEKYKNTNAKLKKINCLHLAQFFYFMYDLRKDIFDKQIFTKSNLDAYEIVEIKNYFKIMQYQGKFISTDEKDVWQEYALKIYKPYSENVIKVFN